MSSAAPISSTTDRETSLKTISDRILLWLEPDPSRWLPSLSDWYGDGPHTRSVGTIPKTMPTNNEIPSVYISTRQSTPTEAPPTPMRGMFQDLLKAVRVRRVIRSADRLHRRMRTARRPRSQTGETTVLDLPLSRLESRTHACER